MSAAAGCELIGRWRIVEADLWDRDYLDLVDPAHITFGKNGRGEFAFGVVNATMELGYGQRIVSFNWTGFDEGDEICGSGSAELDNEVSRMYGVLPQQQIAGEDLSQAEPCWIVLDPTLHVLVRVPFTEPGAGSEALFEFLARLPQPAGYGGLEIPAPVLVLPNVFERPVCERLIAYEEHGGGESGVMRNERGVFDYSFKRRKDPVVRDPQLLRLTQHRLMRRVAPELEKLFFLRITRIERYVVACYAAEDAAHFNPHRDNGGLITAHRRFAVSINLDDDFDGGELVIPEYSRRGFKVPAGWAVVFPCTILHAVRMVARGRRYAFLPFLYDEEGARIRAENRKLLAAADQVKAPD